MGFCAGNPARALFLLVPFFPFLLPLHLYYSPPHKSSVPSVTSLASLATIFDPRSTPTPSTPEQQAKAKDPNPIRPNPNHARSKRQKGKKPKSEKQKSKKLKPNHTRRNCLHPQNHPSSPITAHKIVRTTVRAAASPPSTLPAHHQRATWSLQSARGASTLLHHLLSAVAGICPILIGPESPSTRGRAVRRPAARSRNATRCSYNMARP